MIFLNVYVEQANMNGKTEKSITRNFTLINKNCTNAKTIQREY